MAMEPIGDQLNIDTPELVSIELPLAGIGSRFIAILVDSLILGAALILLSLSRRLHPSGSRRFRREVGKLGRRHLLSHPLSAVLGLLRAL